MIKRTLYFGNPAYLSIKLDQLVIQKPGEEESVTIPVEDIAVVLLDHQQITITQEVFQRLLSNKTALISCDKRHMPLGLMLPMEANYTQTEVQRHQINASVPLKKQLWQQTVIAKIKNQKQLLQILGKDAKRLSVLERRVQSGDAHNVEAQAAVYYWAELFDNFVRDRYGEPPNNLLNYGYAVLRAMVARSLVSSGLLPTLGIFHQNKYNAFGLADDVMEPFRPFVDRLVYQIYLESSEALFLSKDAKARLLSIAVVDALFGKKKRPLMVGMSYTTKSLADCFEGSKRKFIYPEFC